MADGEGDDPPLFREITALVEDNFIAHTSSRSPRARDGASNTHDLPTHDITVVHVTYMLLPLGPGAVWVTATCRVERQTKYDISIHDQFCHMYRE